MNLTNESHFRFIEVSIKNLSIGRIMDLAIDKTVFTGTDIAVGFSGLFLW